MSTYPEDILEMVREALAVESNEQVIVNVGGPTPLLFLAKDSHTSPYCKHCWNSLVVKNGENKQLGFCNKCNLKWEVASVVPYPPFCTREVVDRIVQYARFHDTHHLSVTTQIEMKDRDKVNELVRSLQRTLGLGWSAGCFRGNEGYLDMYIFPPNFRTRFRNGCPVDDSETIIRTLGFFIQHAKEEKKGQKNADPNSILTGKSEEMKIVESKHKVMQKGKDETSIKWNPSLHIFDQLTYSLKKSRTIDVKITPLYFSRCDEDFILDLNGLVLDRTEVPKRDDCIKAATCWLWNSTTNKRGVQCRFEDGFYAKEFENYNQLDSYLRKFAL